MTDITNLLADSGIRKAAIIDDAFDEAPRTDDLEVDSWNTFWDDIADYEDAISKIYPAYSDTDREALQESDEFISSLWERREELPPGTRTTLFEDYEQKSPNERVWLNELAQSLRSLGLECVTLGREFADAARDADLVFIDLFLGFWESQSDMEQAIEGINELVRGRESSPPLVILMSRSSRLADKRNEFRDRAGLLGSTFRVRQKRDLDEEGAVEILLTRLASHYDDAKRVAAFVDAWDSGLDAARKRFISILRRLDLPDLAQIRALLLDFEGQLLGEYLLDVADRVLQYEIEAEVGTISAAQELNKIALDKYPAPHLAGSPDLQDLVHRMIFQHFERANLSFDGKIPTIQYGDVLRCKDKESDTLTNDVYLVATPTCDLAREGMEHVLVLPGTLTPLAPSGWSYGATTTKTPIFTSRDGSRYWIRWLLKKRQTITLTTLCEGLQNGDTYQRLGRIRETYANEIQQKMLADMGRIGQPATPPATFPVSLSLYAVSSNGTVRSVIVDGVDTAVCFVGRDASGNRVDHLVLGEAACDALKGMIQKYSRDGVHTAARQSLTALKTDLDFFERFEKGSIEVPKKDGKWQEEKGEDNRVYFHIVRNDGVDDGQHTHGNHRNAPFVMKVSDILSSPEE